MAKITSKNTKLESVLREMVRDVIFEELTSGFDSPMGHDSWKTRTPDDPNLPFFEPEDQEDMYGEPPMDAMTAHLEPGPVADPEANMNPINREKMIDSLLDMEFQESSTKSIPVGAIREMIRSSVRKHMKK